MRIIESSFSELESLNLYQKIELAGRTCYKSENYITDTSALDFTRRIMSYNHGSVLEHAYLVFEIVDQDLYHQIKALNHKFIKLSNINRPLMSLNFRVLYGLYLEKEKYSCFASLFALMNEKYPDILPYNKVNDHKFILLDDKEVHALKGKEKDLHLSISIRFICDRGVSHELVRHRLCSFSQESTRYCNYAKDKFSHEITFIKPYGLTEEQNKIWLKAMNEAEKYYFALIEHGAKPEQARSCLPNSLKTEIVTTCTLDEWKLIFNLRCAANAHPDIRNLMIKLEDYFKKKGYL